MRTPVVVKYTAMKPQVAFPSVSVSAIDSRVESGISSSSSSVSGTHEAWVSGSITVKSSHPRCRGLADLDGGLDSLRQVDIHSGAEADQPDAFALFDLRALCHVRHDAP